MTWSHVCQQEWVQSEKSVYFKKLNSNITSESQYVGKSILVVDISIWSLLNEWQIYILSALTIVIFVLHISMTTTW